MVSKMYLIRVLFFVGDVRFNVRGEHVPGCLGREGGLVAISRGYTCLSRHFLFLVYSTIHTRIRILILKIFVPHLCIQNMIFYRYILYL